MNVCTTTNPIADSIYDLKDKIRLSMVFLDKKTDDFYKNSLSKYENIVLFDSFDTPFDCIDYLEMIENKIDVVVIAINRIISIGLYLIKKIKNRFPKMKVIVLIENDDKDMIFKAFSTGADSYILKSENKEELYHAIMKLF